MGCGCGQNKTIVQTSVQAELERQMHLNRMVAEERAQMAPVIPQESSVTASSDSQA